MFETKKNWKNENDSNHKKTIYHHVKWLYMHVWTKDLEIKYNKKTNFMLILLDLYVIFENWL